MADGEFPDPGRSATYHWPFGGSGGWAPIPPEPPIPPVRAPRLGLVVGVAALTALLIGGGAGYGGAQLAGAGTAPVSTTTPTAAPSSPPAPVPAGKSVSMVEVARRLLPSTVMIEVGGRTGSGFVLDRSGHVMTNNHVVAGAAPGEAIRVVFSDGRRSAATLVGRSPSYDLAVIRVAQDKSLQAVQTGDSDRAQVGEPVVAVGSPLGLPGTVTQGIVSAVNRPLMVDESSSADTPSAYIDGIQTDAPINPGNSGGPLVDASARVIGVNSAILTMGSGRSQTGNIGLGFAIPIKQARVIASLLIKDGHATYPVIGAGVRDASGAVQLTAVDEGGPAHRAGLRVGDLVTQIDGSPVRRSEELIVSVRTRRPGDTVTLSYARGSQRQAARVTLGGREG